MYCIITSGTFHVKQLTQVLSLCKCRIQVMGWILFKAETSWVGWVQNFWVELGLFEKVANARL